MLSRRQMSNIASSSTITGFIGLYLFLISCFCSAILSRSSLIPTSSYSSYFLRSLTSAVCAYAALSFFCSSLF
jgi:hypothetical protein